MEDAKNTEVVPPPSSSSDQTRAVDGSIEERDAPSQTTPNEPISTSQDARHSVEGGPRQRKKTSDTPPQNDDEEEQKSVSDKQKFTVVGQLKATIFNSWINVLLVAAPIGSTLHRGILCITV